MPSPRPATMKKQFVRHCAALRMSAPHPDMAKSTLMTHSELAHRRKIRLLGATYAGEVCHIAQLFGKDAAQLARSDPGRGIMLREIAQIRARQNKGCPGFHDVDRCRRLFDAQSRDRSTPRQ